MPNTCESRVRGGAVLTTHPAEIFRSLSDSVLEQTPLFKSRTCVALFVGDQVVPRPETHAAHFALERSLVGVNLKARHRDSKRETLN